MTGAPTLDAYVTEDRANACIWCAHCVRWHRHGHVDPTTAELGAGNGHRAAHCHDPASPYDDRGYYIREVAWWPDRPHWGELPVICRGCRQPFRRNRHQRRWCYDCSPPRRLL